MFKKSSFFIIYFLTFLFFDANFISVGATSTNNPGVAVTQIDIPKRIKIDKIDLDFEVKVVEGKPGNWPVPEDLPATASYQSRVGGNTNLSIWGHRSRSFKRLGELGKSDLIEIEGGTILHKYRVVDSKIITPGSDDFKIMAPTQERILTLITCQPEGSTSQRLIVVAKPI